MTKFLLAYKGGAMAATEAEQQAAMEKWMNWFGELGPAIVDGGAPFGPSATVASGGVSDGASAALSGYSVLEAGSLDEATKLAGGCPVLSAGGTVEVYESLPM